MREGKKRTKVERERKDEERVEGKRLDFFSSPTLSFE
jgi:hypothetical protein